MAKQLECKPCRLKKPFVEGALGYTMDSQEGDANTPVRMLTRGRLVVDPDMAVADLMKVLDGFMVEHGTRDLAKLTACPVSGMTWKSAPCIRWLAGLASLYSAFAVFAPNGPISGRKHKLALERLHSLEAINLTNKSDADFFDMIDDRIRIGFKQYRVMKQCPLTKDRSFKKASPHEMAAIEPVLAALTLDGSTFGDTSGNSQAELAVQETERQPRSAGSSHGQGQLTSWQQPESTDVVTWSGKIESTGVVTWSGKIFRRILSKQTREASSCASPPAKDIQQHRPGKSVGSPGLGAAVGSLLKPGEFDSNEERLLRDTVGVKPTSQGGKSQVQRLRAFVGKGWRKGRGKGKGQAAKVEDTRDKAANNKGRGRGRGKNAKPQGDGEQKVDKETGTEKADKEKDTEKHAHKTIKTRPASAAEAEASEAKWKRDSKCHAIVNKCAAPSPDCDHSQIPLWVTWTPLHAERRETSRPCGKEKANEDMTAEEEKAKEAITA